MTSSALVIGGGTMGIGIVEVLLDAEATVVLVEPDLTAAERVRARLADRSGLKVTDAVPESLDVELAIEAVPEDLSLKQRILAAVERTVPGECLLASNTSSLSINAIAGSLQHPERFIGMHFFNPVPKSLLVELVVGTETSSPTIESAAVWLKRLGKEHITVRDSPGFATSRLGIAIGMEAIRMVEEGVASAEDIDRGMVLGYRFPHGSVATHGPRRPGCPAGHRRAPGRRARLPVQPTGPPSAYGRRRPPRQEDRYGFLSLVVTRAGVTSHCVHGAISER